ncbi:facilitated trehalose transporter Tret1-like [Epargyreus clarus]|uniref:facilitated trehalose transporter Tret1-like n=1 Tax=Epargyreus clarus TaxID=520877 RepID=UPI003C2C5ED5
MQPNQLSTYPDPGFWTKTSLIQLGYGLWVNLSMVVIGLAFGFTAVAMPQLKESHIETTISDQSWIASVLTLSAPFGCIISGYSIDKVGRRIMLIVCHFPVALGWLYTGVATSAESLIVGRIIIGIGMGMALSVPRPYLTEISLPNMRGVIGSFPNLAMSVGITAQAALGSFFKWTTLCYISMFYSLALMGFNYFLPETPYYLLMNDTMERAEASLRKFRSSKHNIDAEMDELMDFKMDNDIHGLPWKEKFAALFKRSSCKPFFLMMTYFTITQLAGISVVIMWTVDMLERSKSSVDAHTGNFILGITRFLSGVFTSIIIFKMGRRPLALTSGTLQIEVSKKYIESILFFLYVATMFNPLIIIFFHPGLGVGVVFVFLGFFIHYTEKLTHIPLICYMAYITFATLGHYTLPVLIMFELYPLQVRGILGGISTSIMNFTIFGMNKFYPYMIDTFGFANTIIAFGVLSLIGNVFLYFYLPETKDLTLQEIEEYYNDRRPTLTSQRRIMSMHTLSKQVLSRNDTASKSLIKITDRHKKPKSDKSKTKVNTDKKDVATSISLSESDKHDK